MAQLAVELLEGGASIDTTSHPADYKRMKLSAPNVHEEVIQL
ncbi:MAG: hypothetical protein ACYSUI_12670 [Planctomycetota bacterium]